MDYKYMGFNTRKELENCQTDTYKDYDGNIITLSDKAKEMFTEMVSRIKDILNCDTPIVNGDMEIIDSEQAIHGANFNQGEIIIIDNFYIDEAYNINCLRKSLVETICHEIAHNKYDYHGRWHSRLTHQYYEKVITEVLK